MGVARQHTHDEQACTGSNYHDEGCPGNDDDCGEDADAHDVTC